MTLAEWLDEKRDERDRLFRKQLRQWVREGCKPMPIYGKVE